MWYNVVGYPIFPGIGAEGGGLTVKEKVMSDIVPKWLSTREAMARLGIGRTRLWMLVKEGRLTAYQLGPNRKARFYAKAEVERLANEVRSAPSPHHGEDRG